MVAFGDAADAVGFGAGGVPFGLGVALTEPFPGGEVPGAGMPDVSPPLLIGPLAGSVPPLIPLPLQAANTAKEASAKTHKAAERNPCLIM